jgi:regulator of replication initiation timing
MEDTDLAKKSKAELIAMVEDLTTRLDGNKTIVVNLQAENDELKKKLAAAEATVITNSTKALTAEIAAERKANSALRELVTLSCKDHCPHHLQQEACRNCSIHRKLSEIIGAKEE